MIENNDDILEIIKFVEKVHHPKEEQLLFPFIASNPLLAEGGPLCTYFKGVDLDLEPLSAPRARLNLFYSKGGSSPSPYPEFDWLPKSSPLSIPMYEHQIGHALAEAILSLSSHEKEELYSEFFLAFRNDYVSLLKKHIDKEDRCLFVMCERMIP